MFADPSAAERAYQRLKDDILTGALAAGPLDIRGLGDQLKMSVTPVREALARLSAERLVKLAPHHGYAVASLSARGLRDLYELAGALTGFLIQRRETSVSPGSPPTPLRAGNYPQDMANLMRDMAAGQSNRELAEHFLAINDRLFPARRCEPILFLAASEEIDLLILHWKQQNLAELRRCFDRHHLSRMERAETISSVLSEGADDR